MKFEIADVFAGVDRRAYEAVMFDEAFCEAAGAAQQLGRKLLRLDRTADRVVRHVCFEPAREAGSPADRAFGTSRASFVEELDYDLRAGRGAWRTIPNLFTERVRNAGTLEVSDVGGGVRRLVRGEVAVSLLGFGRVVERMVVKEIETSYARTTAFTNDWLRRTRPSG